MLCTKCPKWMCLRGSEGTSFVDAFFMQQPAEVWQLNSKLRAFYYNSVLIIMLCIWQSKTLLKSLIFLLFVLLAMRAEEIITVVSYYNEALLQQRNSTKCISARCNFRKHMQIEKAPANQENVFIIFTADGTNAHKYILFAARFFFGCVVSNCSMCIVKLTKVFS